MSSSILVLLKRVLRRSPRLYTFAQSIFPYLTAARGLVQGRRGANDHLLSTLSLIRRSPIIGGRPMNITLEPTNLCNLRCPVCETGAGILGREPRTMSFEQFVAILDKIAPHTNTLLFYFMGEPFLNKDAYRMIRHAKDQGIPWVTTCTNGELIDPSDLVDCGLDEVSFQIGGMTQETHAIYRVNGHLELALSNLRETLRIRRERGRRMRISCGFILMKHNEHEVSGFLKEMAVLGVDEALINDPCVRTVEQGFQFLPRNQRHWLYDVQAFKEGRLQPKLIPANACPWLWYSLSIQVNGDVVPCCRDALGEFVMGNLLTQNLAEIWNGEKFVAFRKAILTNQRALKLCRLCSSYPASIVR